jgi:RNA recognition motif-containing protein
MKKLFVGNLSWKATEDSLKQHFEQCGEVLSAKIVIDQYTGKSKGFGFVEMSSPKEAQQAIDKLNGVILLDRELRVSLAQERPERPRSAGGGSGGNKSYGGGGGRDSYNNRE